MELFLKKEIVFNKILSDEAVLAYLALRGILTHDFTTEYVSLNRLAFILLGDIGDSYKPSLLLSLASGIYQLDYFKFITIKTKIGNNDYILDISNIMLNTQVDYFIKVNQEEIRKILLSGQRADQQLKLLRYFLCTIAYLNHSKSLGKFQGKIGEIPIKTIATAANISNRSGIRYNTFLLSQNLIYIYHSPKTKQTNTYSRYRDMNLCIEYGKLKEERTN